MTSVWPKLGIASVGYRNLISNNATCHTQGRGSQYNSEETIPSDSKAGEASLGHVNGTLPKRATL